MYSDFYKNIQGIWKILDNEISKKNNSLIMNNLDNKDGIVIVASGTSYTSAQTALPLMENSLKKPIILYYPKIFLQKKNYLKNYAYIFISQSGESKGIIEAAKKIKEYKIAISENKISSLSKQTNDILTMHALHENIAFKSIGYYTTLIQLLKVSKYKFSKNIEPKNNFSKLSKIAKKIVNGINKKNNITFIGTNYFLGVSNEASLKIREMSWLRSGTFELENFAHGSDSYVNNDDIYFILNDDSDDELKLSRKYKSVLKKHDAKEVYIYSLLLAKETNELARIVAYASLSQLVSYYLNDKFKRNKSGLRFRDLVKDTKVYG